MNVNTYDHTGKVVGQTRLPSEIFEVPLNSDLLHQVVVSQMANRRQGTAHTKDRQEVRGGGRKPWRQKGTGRARHGSIRSPLWRGGGVTFGPRKEKVYERKIPQKMRLKALFMVLSEKAKNNFLIILDELKTEKLFSSRPADGGIRPKTKTVAGILKNLPCKEKSVLLALPSYDKNMYLSARNISKVRPMPVSEINALDLLSFQYLIMPKEALKVIKDNFLK